jgi:hypothetical protein
MRIEIDAASGTTPGSKRHPLTNSAAERIAASADRLQQHAAELRATDKRLALRLVKEAMKLRKVARGLDIQHKQADRVRMRRKDEVADMAPQDAAEAGWSLFFGRQEEDDASLGQGSGP